MVVGLGQKGVASILKPGVTEKRGRETKILKGEGGKLERGVDGLKGAVARQLNYFLSQVQYIIKLIGDFSSLPMIS